MRDPVVLDFFSAGAPFIRPNVPVWSFEKFRWRMERYFPVIKPNRLENKLSHFHSRVFRINGNNTINLRRRNWTRVEITEWNIFLNVRITSRGIPKIPKFYSGNFLLHSIRNRMEQKFSGEVRASPGISGIFGQMGSALGFLQWNILKTVTGQSRTQSPQALWSATGDLPGETLAAWRTGILLAQDFCGKTIQGVSGNFFTPTSRWRILTLTDW